MRRLLTLGLVSLLLAIPVAASAQEAYTTRTVNVRAGPDTSYPPVATLAPGAPVEVMGCLDDWSWCDVVFGYNRGWVYAPYLNYVYQGVRVPFYTYAPSFGIPIISFSLGSYWDRYYRGRPWYGRRDYWERREPRHVRPPGPSPLSTPPSFRERADYQGRGAPSGRPAYTDNRGTPPVGNNRPPREAGSPPPERRGYQGAPGGGPPPPSNQPRQEMRRASPTQGGPPPAAVQGGPRAAPAQQGGPPPPPQGGPRGAEKSRAPEGEKGHGKEHEGAKQ